MYGIENFHCISKTNVLIIMNLKTFLNRMKKNGKNIDSEMKEYAEYERKKN